MTQEQKHTALPYFVDERYADNGEVSGYAVLNAFNGLLVAECLYKEDAEFIVRACNSHYELLEALELVRIKLGRITISTQTTALGRDNGLRLRKECYDLIAAAIAKASGGQDA